MPDYQNGKIYSIRSHQTDKFYIGSTCSPLYKRLYEHRNKYNEKKVILSSFEIIKFDDHYIELIEDYKCENRNQLTKREGEYIRQNINNIVNIKIAGREKKEYYKIYADANRKIINEKNKKYRDANKDMINEKAKQYYIKNKDIVSEKAKQYYIKNKDVIDEKHKKYREDNKDVILEKAREKRELLKNNVNDTNI
jgi:hypothetical protein